MKKSKDKENFIAESFNFVLKILFHLKLRYYNKSQKNKFYATYYIIIINYYIKMN